MLKAHYKPRTVSRIKARQLTLGHIHAAKAQLNLSEATYRNMVSEASKNVSESSADLDHRGRARLLKAMEQKGYVPAEPSERSIELAKRRHADLGAIHIAAKALALPETAYRKMVKVASEGKTMTSADMNARERARLIQNLAAQLETQIEAEEVAA